MSRKPAAKRPVPQEPLLSEDELGPVTGGVRGTKGLSLSEIRDTFHSEARGGSAPRARIRGCLARVSE